MRGAWNENIKRDYKNYYKILCIYTLTKQICGHVTHPVARLNFRQIKMWHHTLSIIYMEVTSLSTRNQQAYSMEGKEGKDSWLHLLFKRRQESLRMKTTDWNKQNNNIRCSCSPNPFQWLWAVYINTPMTPHLLL